MPGDGGDGDLSGPLVPAERESFLDDLVAAYEDVVGTPGLFCYMQMRAELRR